jgi:hypothetical protein
MIQILGSTDEDVLMDNGLPLGHLFLDPFTPEEEAYFEYLEKD